MVGNAQLGKPFDLLVLAGPQTASGRNLRDVNDVAPIIGEALFLLGASPLRAAAFGATDNLARVLEGLTRDGRPTCWGSLGIVCMRFNGPQIARYFASTIASDLLRHWAEQPPGDLTPTTKGAIAGSSLSDVDSFMTLIHRREDGRTRLGDFAVEVARALKQRKAKAKALLGLMNTFGENFHARMGTALSDGEAAAATAIIDFTAQINSQVKQAVDAAGPRTGMQVAALAASHVSVLLAAAEEHRETLKRELEQAEADLEPAVKGLEVAVARSRTGLIFGVRKHLKKYLTTASEAFRLRHGVAVTRIGLARLAQLQEELSTLTSQLECLQEEMVAAAGLSRSDCQAFEARRPTRIGEIIDRPLFRERDLERLYGWATGSDWRSVPDSLADALRNEIGGLSNWIGADGETIRDCFMAACLPHLMSVSSLTADGFVRWLNDCCNRPAALVLRDARALAPVLARFDRSRYAPPETAGDTSLAILGVPVAETSVFAGTPHVLVVSTGDPQRIMFVTLTVGYPSDAIWHFPRYEHANRSVREECRVAHVIYPGFRDEDGAEMGRRRQRRRE